MKNLDRLTILELTQIRHDLGIAIADAEMIADHWGITHGVTVSLGAERAHLSLPLLRSTAQPAEDDRTVAAIAEAREKWEAETDRLIAKVTREFAAETEALVQRLGGVTVPTLADAAAAESPNIAPISDAALLEVLGEMLGTFSPSPVPAPAAAGAPDDRANGLRMPPWKPAEDRVVIEETKKASTLGFTRKDAYRAASARLGRSYEAVKSRACGPLRNDIEAAVKAATSEILDTPEADDRAEPTAPAQPLECPPGADAIDATGGLWKTVEEEATALAEPLPEIVEEVVSEAPVSEPAAVAEAAPEEPAAAPAAEEAEDVGDDLWRHLTSVPRPGIWTLQADADLMRLSSLRWPTHEIAAELGVKDADVLARFKVLTDGRFRRADVEERLATMVARQERAAA